MAKYIVHRCHLYKPSTSAINSMAFEPTQQKLALARADGTLLVFDTRYGISLERTFVPVENANTSSETVMWCKKRLFSVGLSGFLTEWSLHHQCHVQELKVSSSPVWCFTKSADEDFLFIGTEDGAILKVKVENESAGSTVRLENPVARTDKRILSMAVQPDGKLLASGSIGDIKVWNLPSGRCLHRITVNKTSTSILTTPQKEKRQDPLIWALAFTKDSVIISGDSRGVTSFWDAKTGTQLCEFNSHTADVLTVVYDEIHHCAYSSGIDPDLVKFVLFKEKSRQPTWDSQDVSSANFPRPVGRMHSTHTTLKEATLYLEERRWRSLHKRDVRCLVLCPPADFRLFIGGLDAQIVTVQHRNARLRVERIHLTDANNIKLATEGNLVLFQYESRVELWKLASVDSKISIQDLEKSGQVLNTVTDPLHYAQIKTSKSNWIVSSCVDKAGDFVAYSDRRKTSVFKIHVENRNFDPNSADSGESVDAKPNVFLEKLNLLTTSIGNSSSICDQSSDDLPSSTSACFFQLTADAGIRTSLCSTSSTLLLLCDDEQKSIFIYEVSALCLKFRRQIDYPDKKSYVRKLIPCDGGTVAEFQGLVACVNSLNDVYLIDVLSKKTLVKKLPRSSALVVDAKFVKAEPCVPDSSVSKSTLCLALVFSDKSLLEYDIDRGRYSDWTRRCLESEDFGKSNSDMSAQKYFNYNQISSNAENSGKETESMYFAPLGLCPVKNGRYIQYGAHYLKSVEKKINNGKNRPPYTSTYTRDFGGLCFLGQLENCADLVAVQVEQKAVDNGLPEPFKSKRFGTG